MDEIRSLAVKFFMKILSIIFMLPLCLFASTFLAFGQACPRFPCVVDSKATGEVASAAIDNLLIKAIEVRERIFVIAHRSKKEKNNALNRDRLCETRGYLLGRLSSGRYNEYVDSQPVVFAEGTAAAVGDGRIDFYLGSRLYLTRFIKLNRTANLDCCGELTAVERIRKKNECIEWKEGIR